MAGAMVATGIIIWPAAPFFLFMHGKDIVIPAGQEVSVYTAEDYDTAKAKGGDSPLLCRLLPNLPQLRLRRERPQLRLRLQRLRWKHRPLRQLRPRLLPG